MADIKQAVAYVLRQEDSTLSGVITNYANDHGGLTRFGLTARFHPELIASGFFDASMPASQALTIAEKTYEMAYGPQLFISALASQGIATALLSFAVNQGNGPAVLKLQKAVNAVDGNILIADSRMGPGTVAAINRTDPGKLIAAWQPLEEVFYRAISTKDPSQQSNLKGWLNRVASNMKLCVEAELSTT